MPVKHVVDELDLYEQHKEFVQVAVSDVEVYQNVGRFFIVEDRVEG